MYGNKTTDLENNFTTDLENDILLLTLKIFLILILRVIFLWELYFSTDLQGHISITDLESDFFTNTFFYHWPWEWYFHYHLFLLLTLRVIFLRRVSSRTACSLWLISRERSRVIALSVWWELYRDPMMLCFLDNSIYK